MYDGALLILNKLKRAGFDAYIVGGYARDKYLGIESYDIDICTSAYPQDIISLFESVNVNLDYLVSIVKYNNYKYEITTFRCDHYTMDGNRKCSVSYSTNLREDLQRRDFTINAICMDQDGNIIDPLNGQRDLQNKLIKNEIK